MHRRIIDRRPAISGLVQVCTPADIEYLVKESEVVTGNPGRKFVICGADRLVYRIAWRPNGYQVERLDESDKPDKHDVPAACAIQRTWLRRSDLSWPALYACVVALKKPSSTASEVSLRLRRCT